MILCLGLLGLSITRLYCDKVQILSFLICSKHKCMLALHLWKRWGRNKCVLYRCCKKKFLLDPGMWYKQLCSVCGPWKIKSFFVNFFFSLIKCHSCLSYNVHICTQMHGINLLSNCNSSKEEIWNICIFWHLGVSIRFHL